MDGSSAIYHSDACRFIFLYAQVSAKLLGPARIATAGFSFITLIGMAKISLSSPGGLKGVAKGLWTAPAPTPPKKVGQYDY